MHRILCVDDAADTLLILEMTLGGHQLQFAYSIKEATELLQRETFSLVLLDIELPDGSGFEVLASLSERLQGTPVIFLTGRQDFASKVSAFSLGAEDFIVKPFDPKELKLRVESKLRKASQRSDEMALLRVGSLVCNLQEQRVMKNGGQQRVDLTSLEFRIFHLLAQTSQKVFSRAEILDRVWGNAISVTDRAVDVHISNLRKKLSGTGVGIEAVIGSGYRIKTDEVPAPTKSIVSPETATTSNVPKMPTSSAHGPPDLHLF